VLQGQVVLSNGQAVTTQNIHTFVGESETTHESVADGGGEIVIVTFPLVSDHLKRRMKPFLPFVRKYCAQYQVDTSQVIATIHTESYFNPVARSSCGAIGLMQLVADQGGAEAYSQLRGANLVPSEAYLYDPEKNIELGCIYMYLLNTRYFGTVSNEESRRYCCIAGYNTGPGNVSYAFTSGREVDPAILKINGMNPPDIYSWLIQYLPFDETRDYLKKVVQRMALYR
jgi:membrane-bound lytic murein transglycosylase C